MFIFGHTGITLGAAVAINSIMARRFRKVGKSRGERGASNQKPSPFSLLGGRVGIRLLFVGSLLPDIIDKPLGLYFFRQTLSNGWLYGHTLLFLLVLSLLGLYLYRRHKSLWCLTFAFGTLTHLIFDQVWLSPHMLLWPIYGFSFPKADVTNWAMNYLNGLLSVPMYYVPEIMGMAIVVWFLWVLLHRGDFLEFIRHGKV